MKPEISEKGILNLGRHVLLEEAKELEAIAGRLDETFVKAVTLILNCKGRVVVSGVGKSGHIARKIAADADVPFQLLDVSLISQLAPNSLTDTSIEMDEDKPADSYPNTFVPGRNMVFLTFAAIMARSKGIFHLVTGVSEADFSGYPDCRDTFVRSLNVTLNLAMDEQFVIHTPLMDRDKSEVWQLSDELGVFDLVRTQTLTCYNGVPADGCGHCPACKLRREGLEKYLRRKLTANK